MAVDLLVLIILYYIVSYYITLYYILLPDNYNRTDIHRLVLPAAVSVLMSVQV